jgi:hypothetical protein
VLTRFGQEPKMLVCDDLNDLSVNSSLRVRGY